MDGLDALDRALDDEVTRAEILADPPRALREYGVTVAELEGLGRTGGGHHDHRDRRRQAVLFALLAHGRRARDDHG